MRRGGQVPRNAPMPCRHVGCRAVVLSPGFCDAHRRESFKIQKQSVTEDYRERNRFYQRKAWKDARSAQLMREPLCRACGVSGYVVAAAVVDHVVAIADGGAEYDFGNLQSLCASCHNAKTGRDRYAPRGG